MAKKLKLRDVPSIRREVPLSLTDAEGNQFVLEVRAINVTDVMVLITHFGPQVAGAYARVRDRMGAKAQDQMTQQDIQHVIMSAIQESPKLIAYVIALATEDTSEEGIAAAEGLSMIDQMNLLVEIINETFRNEAEVKKMVGSVMATYHTATNALHQTTAESLRSGIGDSEGA